MADTENSALPSVFEFSNDVSKETQPSPLPEGRYLAEIVSAEAKISKSGNKYANIAVRIDPNAFPADWAEGNENPDGIVLHYRRVTLEDNKASRFRLQRFVERVGFPSVGTRLDLSDWMGRQVRVDVKPERGQDGLLYATVVDMNRS